MHKRNLLIFSSIFAFTSACTAPTAPPMSVPEPHESEYVKDWDEPGDTVVPPIDELSSQELTELLRISSTVSSLKNMCRTSDLDITARYVDAALGHRFGKLELTNKSSQECAVKGFPGFGARGEWGHKFLLKAEQLDPISGAADQQTVNLAPGESAFANMEWTGSLGGAESEPIESFVIELVKGEAPAVIKVKSLYSTDQSDVTEDGTFPPNTGFDISMDTTVRIGPFRSN